MKIHYIVPFDIAKNAGSSVGTRKKAEKISMLKNHIIVFFLSKNKSNTYPFKTIKIPSLRIRYLEKISYQFAIMILLGFLYIRRSKRPDILLVRHNDILNFGFLLPALLFKIPFFLDVHADIIEELKLRSVAKFIPLCIWKLFKKYEGFLFRESAGIIINQSILEKFFSEVYQIPLNKFCVVPNGADIDEFKPFDIRQSRESLGIELNKRHIIFVGDMKKWHGVEYIIQMIPKLTDLRRDFIIDIIGEGTEYQNIVRLAKELKVEEYVNFAGNCPRHLVPRWIGAADICLLPIKMIRKHPGSPIKLFEYMACGKPILAADVEGYGDFVEENNLGIKVDFTNPILLAKAIDSMIKGDLSPYMINNRFLAETKFSWLNTAKQINDFLSKYKSSI